MKSQSEGKKEKMTLENLLALLPTQIGNSNFFLSTMDNEWIAEYMFIDQDGGGHYWGKRDIAQVTAKSAREAVILMIDWLKKNNINLNNL